MNTELEEAAERISKTNSVYETAQDDFYHGFIAGANWQANQNQEAINKLISIIEWYDDESDVRPHAETFMWFEQFKKK